MAKNTNKKIKELKAEKPSKITNEELNDLQALVNVINKAQMQIGMLQTSIHQLLHHIAGKNDELTLLQSNFEEKYGKNKFWDFIDEDNKVSFWVGIPVMPGAAELVNAVKKYNYELLTAPSVKKQSYLGKILWVRNHSDILGGKPRINFKKAKNKHQVKDNLSIKDILIDDREDTIERWETAGGKGIHYKNAGQVINDLKKLGL